MLKYVSLSSAEGARPLLLLLQIINKQAVSHWHECGMQLWEVYTATNNHLNVSSSDSVRKCTYCSRHFPSVLWARKLFDAAFHVRKQVPEVATSLHCYHDHLFPRLESFHGGNYVRLLHYECGGGASTLNMSPLTPPLLFIQTNIFQQPTTGNRDEHVPLIVYIKRYFSLPRNSLSPWVQTFLSSLPLFK